MRRLAMTVALLAVPMATVSSAHAAFPGRNGVIAVEVERDPPNPSGVWALFPGHRVRPLIPPPSRGRLDTFQFSPGGRVLAFAYREDGAADEELGPPDIWIRSVSRRARARPMIPKPPGTDFHVTGPTRTWDRQPAWSPDGKSIVFTRFHGSFFSATLRVYSHGHSRLLTGDGYGAAWSVRNEIAFVRYTHRADDLPVIYSVRPDGMGLRRLAVGSRVGSRPNWSPDGRRLAFVAPGNHIATVSRDGARRRSVTKDQRCLDSSPSFSPGGGQLTFTRDNGGGEGDCPTEGLVTSRTNGSRLRGDLARISPYSDLGFHLDWQPLRRQR